jgi:TonB family protein
MRSIAAAALLLCATSALGCSIIIIEPDSPLSNPVYSSANQRFRLVVRTYPNIPDFGQRRAEDVWREEEAANGEQQPETYTAVLYEVAFGWPVAIARYELPVNYNEALVSGEGWFVIRPLADEPRLAIYDSGVRELAASDIFTANDVDALRRGQAVPMFAITDEAVVITMPRTIRGSDDLKDYETIHIGRDGKLREEKHDIYPPHRVWTEAVDARPAAWPDCAARDLTRVYTDQLLASSIERPMPEYPDIAKKARISGLVIVDVVVNADGDVVCSRVTKPLPFGLSAAVLKEIHGWKFAPGGGAMAASIGFRFGQPEHDEWERISALR